MKVEIEQVSDIQFLTGLKLNTMILVVITSGMPIVSNSIKLMVHVGNWSALEFLFWNKSKQLFQLRFYLDTWRDWE